MAMRTLSEDIAVAEVRYSRIRDNIFINSVTLTPE